MAQYWACRALIDFFNVKDYTSGSLVNGEFGLMSKLPYSQTGTFSLLNYARLNSFLPILFRYAYLTDVSKLAHM